MAKYGILLVSGAHTHQEMYGAAFAADPRCQLIAVTDEADIDKRRRELNERLAKLLKVPYIADLGEALAKREVDVVCSCAPPERRGRIAVRCAQAGKHLYLDKSLCPKLKEADDLVSAVKKAQVKSHMFSFISAPWARQAKEIIESGQLGKIVAVHADAFFAKGKTGTADLTKKRKEEYPPERHQLMEAKREFDNVGVYPIVMIHFLTGKKFERVHGVTGNCFFAEHQKANVEDFGMLAGTLEGDVPVSIAAGRYGWTSHPAAGVHRLMLVGSERTIVVDANRPRLEVYTDEAPWTPPQPHPEDPMFFWSTTQEEMGVKPKRTWVNAGPAVKSDAAYFLDRLDAGKDSELSVVEAAHAAEVLLATFKSAATGEAVKLPLPR